MEKRESKYALDLSSLDHVETGDPIEEGLYRLDMAWSKEVSTGFWDMEVQLGLPPGSLTPLLEKVDRHVRDWRKLANQARAHRRG